MRCVSRFCKVQKGQHTQTYSYKNFFRSFFSLHLQPEFASKNVYLCNFSDYVVFQFNKEQVIDLKENTDKANRAEANVKDIAVKAIENASKVRMISGKIEKNEEF